jgi:hypothetical protein
MSDPDQTRIDILVDDLRALLEARGVEAKIVDVLTALVRTGFESGNWRFTDAEPARGPASSPLARQIMAKAFRAVGKKNQNPEFLEAAADLERAAQRVHVAPRRGVEEGGANRVGDRRGAGGSGEPAGRGGAHRASGPPRRSP